MTLLPRISTYMFCSARCRGGRSALERRSSGSIPALDTDHTQQMCMPTRLLVQEYARAQVAGAGHRQRLKKSPTPPSMLQVGWYEECKGDTTAWKRWQTHTHERQIASHISSPARAASAPKQCSAHIPTCRKTTRAHVAALVPHIWQLRWYRTSV